MNMLRNGHVPLPSFRILERSSATVPSISDLNREIRQQLSALDLPSDKLQGHSIAVAVGSRGIASLAEIVRSVCGWLKDRGAHPFVFPAMGSHGGATVEGQRKILEDYGITPDTLGVEVRASMEATSLGTTPQGPSAFMDRNAWESSGVVVINRIKPHTDFTGKIESGLLKMMAVGMGKVDGASECHRWGRRFGMERTIRAVAGHVLATGKVLCGVGLVENEFHQIAAVRAARPENLVAMEEQALAMARPLVPRMPFSQFQLLIVDEMGKNVSGSGMDTKVIGRGVKLQPGEAPEIDVIYVRDLTLESRGNALGIGLADLMHERLYRKIDLHKMYANARTSMNPPMPRLPIFWPSDREALDFALGALGSPEPAEQHTVWIRNTLSLDRLAVSEGLANEAGAVSGWRVLSEVCTPEFDAEGNLASPL
jgi:hypothetical protein